MTSPAIEKTNSSNSLTLRVSVSSEHGTLAQVNYRISEVGGEIVALDIVKSEKGHSIRDITVNTSGPEHAEKIKKSLENIEGCELISASDRTFLIHVGGKIEVKSRTPIRTRNQLSMAYTPGVARVCTAIHEDPEKVFKLTSKRNMVAIVTDGSAVLGLGNIGPEASLPVMEGKAMLFKDFGGVNAFPICLSTQNVDEIVSIVKNISPGFGGVNLEDIAAPRCFEIERRLTEELDIPIFHDDQHGTAVVLVAGVINALKIVKKKPEDLKIVVAGVGAAGTACTKMLMNIGVKNIIGCDRNGAVHQGRSDLNEAKQEFAQISNPNHEEGSIHDVIKGADIFVGVSGPDILNVEDIKNMADDPIVFAMSNPNPEIKPELAIPHVAIMATGRSDYPNQINNVLCFPGIFRGALDCMATTINDEMKIAAAHAIADVIPEDQVNADYIIPSVFNKEVALKVAEAVKNAAINSGVGRKRS